MDVRKQAIHAAVVLLMMGVAWAGDAQVFQSQTAGFQVAKPADWHFLTAEQNLQNLESLRLSDEEFHAAMQRYATAPLVAMSKFEEPYDDVNPSLKVNIKPFGQLKGKRPAEIIELLVPQFMRVFKDFELVQAPIDVQVSGLDSAYARMNYSMETPDGRSFPTTSELWVVPRGGYFFLIGAGTRQDEKNGSRAEISAIVETIRIEHQEASNE